MGNPDIAAIKRNTVQYGIFVEQAVEKKAARRHLRLDCSLVFRAKSPNDEVPPGANPSGTRGVPIVRVIRPGRGVVVEGMFGNEVDLLGRTANPAGVVWSGIGLQAAAALAGHRMTTPAQRVTAEERPKAMTGCLQAVASHRDRNAFAELFQYYGPRVKSYLLRLGTDDESAEELMQEVMLLVWRKAEQFDASKAAAGTWIFAIARNLRVDALRRQKRPEIDHQDPALVPDGDPRADTLVEREEQWERVRAVLRSLPREQAHVIEMSFFDDKPHSEIATELNLPLGTVKSRIRLAMGRIRNAMGDEQ